MSKNTPESTNEAIDIRIPFTRPSTAQQRETTTKTAEPHTTTGETVDCEILPMQPNRTDCQCNSCGEPWGDGEKWEKHVIKKQTEAIPQPIGDLHKYECPTCEEKTFKRISPLSLSDTIAD